MISDSDRKVIEDIIHTTVKQTIRELVQEEYIKDSSDIMYSESSKLLFNYFKNGSRDIKITKALEDFKHDSYLDVLYLYFQDHCTIENIAELLNVDVSTIVRNKKRLCLEIYKRIC